MEVWKERKVHDTKSLYRDLGSCLLPTDQSSRGNRHLQKSYFGHSVQSHSFSPRKRRVFSCYFLVCTIRVPSSISAFSNFFCIFLAHFMNGSSEERGKTMPICQSETSAQRGTPPRTHQALHKISFPINGRDSLHDHRFSFGKEPSTVAAR